MGNGSIPANAARTEPVVCVWSVSFAGQWAGAFGSQGKAMASAAFGRPSGDLTPRADHPTLRGIAAAEGNHMFYGQGAVPIFRQGVLIGACGVGGGTAQEDEDCARAGVENL